MYFNNIVENVCNIPRYFIDDALEKRDLLRMLPDDRHIIGKKNKIQRFVLADAHIKNKITDVSTYIQSQQLPFLKNMVSYESGIASLDESTADIIMPTRYIARVGEQLIVPLSGTATVISSEFEDSATLIPGFVYRLNNRVNSTFTVSENFLTIFLSMIDFDLKRYLMPHDFNAPYTRKKDEYADAGAAPDIVEEQPVY